MVVQQGYSQEDSIQPYYFLPEIIIDENAVKTESNIKNNKENVQTSVDELLSKMSGISLIKRGNFALEPTVRGLNSAQIIMTIDGMAIFGACTDRMDPISSYIEPNNLESIHAKFSPDGSSHGSNIGGGFNFKTKEPRFNSLGDNPWSGRVGIGYQTNAVAFQSLVSVNYSKEKFALNLNGIYRASKDYYAGGSEVVRFSQYKKWNGSMQGKFLLNGKNVLSAMYLQDEGYNIGYPALPMDVKYAKAKISSLTHTYLGNDSKLKSWKTKAYFNYIDHAMDDTKRPQEDVPIHMDMPGTSQTFGVYSETGLQLSPKNELDFRLDIYNNRLHSEMTMYPDTGAAMFMLTIPDGNRSVASLNISNQHRFSDKWRIDLGGRLEWNYSSIYSREGRQTLSSLGDFKVNKSRLIYNAYVQSAYSVNDNWTLSAQVAKGMRAPSTQELYGFYLFNRADAYDYIGNPNLKSESSWNINTSVGFHKRKIHLEARLFAYLFQNYIVGIHVPDYSTMAHGAIGVKQFSNLSTAKLLGAELDLHATIIKGLEYTSSNSFTYGFDSKKNALPTIPPFKTNNQLKYRLKSWTANLEGIFGLKQKHVNYNFYGETLTPSFFVMNASVSYKQEIKNRQSATISFAVDNILDRNYYEHLDLIAIPRIGRNFIFQITYEF